LPVEQNLLIFNGNFLILSELGLLGDDSVPFSLEFCSISNTLIGRVVDALLEKIGFLLQR
jgi:hypothetical protein